MCVGTRRHAMNVCMCVQMHMTESVPGKQDFLFKQGLRGGGHRDL